MKYFSLLILSFVFCNAMYAQNEFGPKLNVGASFMYVHLESNPPQQGVTQDNFPLFSGHAGLFFNHRFGDRALFGTELLFVPIWGRQHFKLMFTDATGNFTGEYAESQVYRHALYVSLPVYFGLTFNKTSITLGPQIGYCFASGGREEGTVLYQGETSTYTNTADQLGIDIYDFGVHFGAIYQLNNRFSLNASAYCGINNILEGDNISEYWKWRAFQLTAGVRWNILGSKE